MTPNNLNHVTTKHYLKKVKVLVAVISIVCPGASIIAALIPMMYLSLGYLPFSYIPVSMIWSAFSPLSLFMVTCSAREKMSTHSRAISPLSGFNLTAVIRKSDAPEDQPSSLNESNSILNNPYRLQTNYLTTHYEESRVQSNKSGDN